MHVKYIHINIMFVAVYPLTTGIKYKQLTAIIFGTLQMNDCRSRKSIDIQDGSYRLSSGNGGALWHLTSPRWTLTLQGACPWTSSQPWSLFRSFLDSYPCRESPHPDLSVTDELLVHSSTQNPCFQTDCPHATRCFLLPPVPPQGTACSKHLWLCKTKVFMFYFCSVYSYWKVSFQRASKFSLFQVLSVVHSHCLA